MGLWNCNNTPQIDVIDVLGEEEQRRAEKEEIRAKPEEIMVKTSANLAKYSKQDNLK